MVVDLSVRHQTYVEDCEVCCKPIEVTCTAQDDAIVSFDARSLE
jgi:Cysteine-rich CPXCG